MSDLKHLSLLIFVIFTGIFLIVFSVPPRSSSAEPPSFTRTAFFVPQLFFPGLEYARTSKTFFSSQPRILILPHHLVASSIIADLLHASSRFRYKSIYLIGPNHYESGSDKLRSYPALAPDDILRNEHSVQGLIPFITYYFPHIPVTSVLIKHDATPSDISAWAAALRAASSDTLFIFSIDFSHYLPAAAAADKDQLTLNLIRSSDIHSVLRLTNDHVDSPSSLALSLSLKSAINATELRLIHHTNSGYLLRDFTSPTTSYFGLAYFTPTTATSAPQAF